MYFSGISRRLKQTWVLGLLAFALAAPEMANAEVIWLSQDRYVQSTNHYVFVPHYPDQEPISYPDEVHTYVAPDFGAFDCGYQKSSIGPNWFKAEITSPYTNRIRLSGMSYWEDSLENRANVSFRLTEATPVTMKVTGVSPFPFPDVEQSGAWPAVLEFAPHVQYESLVLEEDGYIRGVLPAGDYTLMFKGIMDAPTTYGLDFVLSVPEPASLSGLALAGSALLLRRRSR